MTLLLIILIVLLLAGGGGLYGRRAGWALAASAACW